MTGASDPALVFVALAIVFVALALRDYLREQRQLSPARHTWLRIALIFASVGIGLYVVRLFL
jgi:hypothetical protein